jgi:hypothetical protein
MTTANHHCSSLNNRQIGHRKRKEQQTKAEKTNPRIDPERRKEN